MGLLQRANTELKKHFLASKVVFCTLIGSDVSRVVNDHTITETQQGDVNSAMWEFNCEVFHLNKENSTFAPSLHSDVHRVCNGSKKNYYQHLQDGIHPSKSIMNKWANQFVKAIARN